jgi:hypothetical protein
MPSVSFKSYVEAGVSCVLADDGEMGMLKREN